MDVKFKIESGVKKPRTFLLRSDEIIIGRLRSCPLCIPSAEVSRRHCKLTAADGYLMVEDLGSSNGTWLNGNRLEQLTVVRPGDRLDVGPVKFRIQYELTAEGQAAIDRLAAEAAAAQETAAPDDSTPLPVEGGMDFDFLGSEGQAAGQGTEAGDVPVFEELSADEPAGSDAAPDFDATLVPNEDASLKMDEVSMDFDETPADQAEAPIQFDDAPAGEADSEGEETVNMKPVAFQPDDESGGEGTEGDMDFTIEIEDDQVSGKRLNRG
jgi:predicted component of type VI protein secretion system